MTPAFQFRPGTQDEAIYHSVVTSNEYRLPERFEPDSIVIDIGAHIGSFGHLALSRGAGRVYAFEAEASNWAAARANLAGYGDRAVVAHEAVWRSDRPATRLSFVGSSDASNTGGGGVLGGPSAGAESVAATPLDDVLERVTDGGRRRVAVLKIDCEGSEFPILFTAKKLGWIDRIVGEFHELATASNPAAIPAAARVDGHPTHSIEALAEVLGRHGFTVEWVRAEGSSLGLFYAENRRPRVDAPHRGGRLAAAWARLTGRRAAETIPPQDPRR